jgi:hypothetical protein
MLKQNVASIPYNFHQTHIHQGHSNIVASLQVVRLSHLERLGSMVSHMNVVRPCLRSTVDRLGHRRSPLRIVSTMQGIATSRETPKKKKKRHVNELHKTKRVALFGIFSGSASRATYAVSGERN